LLAGRFSEDQRKAVGWTLLLFGALSTIPLGFEVFGGSRLSAAGRPEPAGGPWSESSEPRGRPTASART
jgi:hypothetical protein